jgi:hypothetical protein
MCRRIHRQHAKEKEHRDFIMQTRGYGYGVVNKRGYGEEDYIYQIILSASCGPGDEYVHLSPIHGTRALAFDEEQNLKGNG